MTLLPQLFPESATADDKRRPTTAGFKIRESIQALVAALSQCHPHYIRCIKPNDKKAANTYVNDRVQHQVKYLGLLENVKVRRAGYAYRQLYDKFFFRYAIINDATWPPEKFNGRFKEGTMQILQALNLAPDGKKQPYAAGATKIFIRAPETVRPDLCYLPFVLTICVVIHFRRTAWTQDIYLRQSHSKVLLEAC